MNQDTKKIINKVEQVTGYRVSVGSDTGFSGQALMITASPQQPVHSITVNQKYSNIGDYIVAMQCAMILVKWSDPENIPDFAVKDNKVSHQIDKYSKDRKLEKFPPDKTHQFVKSIVMGLMHQLISQPVEMIAMDICREECPGLKDIMETSINNTILALHQNLDPKIRQITPTDLFEKNNAMNAALALNWVRMSENEHLLVPFKTVGILDKGKELLKIFDSVPVSDKQRYTKTVDGWADKLQLSSLYTWKYRNA